MRRSKYINAQGCPLQFEVMLVYIYMCCSLYTVNKKLPVTWFSSLSLIKKHMYRNWSLDKLFSTGNNFINAITQAIPAFVEVNPLSAALSFLLIQSSPSRVTAVNSMPYVLFLFSFLCHLINYLINEDSYQRSKSTKKFPRT